MSGDGWIEGPLPKDHDDRLALAREVAERARLRFEAIAVGGYGSLARGEDGPYSDIEMFCVVAGEVDETFEWMHAGWKVEVNVRGREYLARDAATVTETWSITHRNYLDVMPLHDPIGVFAELAAIVHGVPQPPFDRAIERLIVGELWEAIGKLRNARARGELPPPGFLYYVLRLGYSMIGLANRHLYSTATRAWSESLALPDRVAGYDALCRLASTGDLGDASRVFDACEGFWAGVAAWAAARGLSIESPAHLI
ncbi:MAG TPA: kanamycin nucleotidyltransferase C-terminal domain-containing protein [Kofleriaceae bacterium]